MSTFYGYGRHSTRRQELTEDVQRAKVDNFYERELKPKGVKYGGFFYDTAVTGSSPFSEREFGLKVLALAQPDDYVVSSRLDRCFRNTLDGLKNIEQFAQKGVTFYSLDMPMVFADKRYGKLMLTVILAFAELDRDITRERTNDVIAYRKAEGLPYCPSPPMGWKIAGMKPNRYFLVDANERAFIDTLFELRKTMTMARIAVFCRTQGQFKLKRPFDNKSAVTWALHARFLKYPKVTSFKRVRRLARLATESPAQPAAT